MGGPSQTDLDGWIENLRTKHEFLPEAELRIVCQRWCGDDLWVDIQSVVPLQLPPQLASLGA